MSCTSNVKNLLFQVSAHTQPSAFSHVTSGVAPKLRKSLDERGGWEVSSLSQKVGVGRAEYHEVNSKGAASEHLPLPSLSHLRSNVC